MSAPALTSPIEPGSEFEVLCELGRGGMGSVRLVRVVGPGEFTRLFVQKRLLPDRANEESALRFVSEGRIAGSIRHANVVRTHHFGQDQEGMFLLLDYVEGASLDQLLTVMAQRGRRLPLPLALRVTLDALSGLGAVHEACDLQGRPLGVLHRDVTLHNLLVGIDGVTRIADFGIAKSVLNGVITDQQYLVGKLRYLSPEYVRREAVDQRMDIYALGVSLWHIVTSRTLWLESNEAELVEHILCDEVPDVGLYVGAPDILSDIVRRACAREPKDRFPSARAMAQAIESSNLPLGTHAEVAEFVRSQLAQQLSERRKLLAEATSRSHAEAKAPLAAVDVLPPARPRARWRPGLVALAFASLGSLGLLGFRALPRASSSAPTSSVPTSVAAPAAPRVVAASASVARAASPVAEHVTPRPSQTARSARVPRPSTRAPSGIVVKNPYRD